MSPSWYRPLSDTGRYDEFLAREPVDALQHHRRNFVERDADWSVVDLLRCQVKAAVAIGLHAYVPRGQQLCESFKIELMALQPHLHCHDGEGTAVPAGGDPRTDGDNMQVADWSARRMRTALAG